MYDGRKYVRALEKDIDDMGRLSRGIGDKLVLIIVLIVVVTLITVNAWQRELQKRRIDALEQKVASWESWLNNPNMQYIMREEVESEGHQ